MNRTLEEILNTPVDFEEGMRVFSLISFKFGTIDQLDSDTGTDYPIDLLDDNGAKTIDRYMIEGKLFIGNTWRHLLTEQEAYEIFPSLKPKEYEYQVIYKSKGKYIMSPHGFFKDKEEYEKIMKNELHRTKFIELYQPSKRERKS